MLCNLCRIEYDLIQDATRQETTCIFAVEQIERTQLPNSKWSKKKEFELTLDLQAPVVQLSPELWNFEDFLDHVSQLQEKHKMYPSCRPAQAEESLERSPQLGKRIDKIVPKVVLEPEFWSVLAATF